ncbi:glycosyltransferase family 2 protein [Nocardioides terrisoli]|uniref:glycosyltransferase family 2 protein n=1 Tax=Nocardioides terrisoli TaxID=3388267 RepID=UPI00287BC1D9|nr:glycosyltransferase family 2 protein [Nocardioides marmorisolisilvae]
MSSETTHRKDSAYVLRDLAGRDSEVPADDFLSGIENPPTHRPMIGCIIPAYNEADSIASVLDSLLMQTRPPDVIHVVVNNSSDETVEVAGHYAGLHSRWNHGQEEFTEIFVHDIGENPDKKVGALNYGFAMVESYDYLLGVDGDTTADPHAIKWLVDEMESDDRIGGISAIYSIDDTAVRGPISAFLIAGQRAQFSAFNMQNLLRGRNMAVLGGQFSIFSTAALRRVMEESHQRSPWVRDSEVEDSLLSLQIKSAGYLTKISAHARANVGGMQTVRSLDAQQVKWNYGAIELMWPGQRGDTKGQPLHPNLRLRWFEHLSMLTNLFTRITFAVLLSASLTIHAYVFYWWWLAPTVVATLLNGRVAHSMRNANLKDYLFALSFVGAEVYMWIRLGHFVRAWTKFASRSQTDNWAAQARAERGAGHGYLIPVFGLLVLFGGLFEVWTRLPIGIQSDSLAVGWPILGIVTAVQTAFMTLKVLRPYRGYKV